MKTLQEWETVFVQKVKEICATSTTVDPSHDFEHYRRVVTTAKKIAELDGADLEVVVAAAWFHDFVPISKLDPRRPQAAKISSDAAVEFLQEVDFPSAKISAIRHAIEAHSFSGKTAAESLEAKIVQDSDRLDAVGAIGIARCFSMAGTLNRPFYDSDDPLCERRVPTDQIWTVDHFYQKLFRVIETLHTESARAEGLRRAQTMRVFLTELKREVL